MAAGVWRHAKDFDCQTCTWKHCDEAGAFLGSKGPAPNGFEQVLDGVEYRICPLPQITALTRQFQSLHSHYKHRLLPLDGGLLSQPNAYLQAMEIIDGYR